MGKMGSFFNIEAVIIRPDFSKTPLETEDGRIFFQRPASQENVHIVNSDGDFNGRPEMGVIYPRLRHVLMGVTYHDFNNACILPIPEGEKGDKLRDIGIFCMPSNNVVRIPTRLRLVVNT